MPAIIGTSRLSWCWLPLSAAPAPARNSSGSAKLKNAALGLRQNILRSRRYWRQVRVSASGTAGLPARLPCAGVGGRRIGVGARLAGQLQVDVLERRAPDRQLLQPLPARKRLAGELVQQRRRVV